MPSVSMFVPEKKGVVGACQEPSRAAGFTAAGVSQTLPVSCRQGLANQRIDPTISSLGLFPRESCAQRNMCKNIYEIIVCNNKKRK